MCMYDAYIRLEQLVMEQIKAYLCMIEHSCAVCVYVHFTYMYRIKTGYAHCG